MDSYEVYRQANRLVKRYGTRDPVKLAKEMGILVYDVPELTNLLGMYTYRWHHRIILMNPNVNETLYRMVLGHEIGHDLRHRKQAGNGGLREFELFDMTNLMEYEANACNAHILIDEHEMMELFHEGYDIAAVAQMLCVNINLLLIKMQEMNRMGMNYHLPYYPDAAFFKHTTE